MHTESCSPSRQIAWLVPLALSLGSLQCTPSRQVDSIPAEPGEILITPITHGSLQLEYQGRVLHIDPWSQGDYRGAPQADWILITDVHADHLDPPLIESLRTEATIVIVPEAASEQVPRGTILRNGESKSFDGLEVEAIPMYNHHRGPEEGQLFHDKGRGNGYVVTLAGRRLYISGDTACTDEMKDLNDIDIAFVTMNLPFTMPPEEAAECVLAFKPKVVYPYHYQGQDVAAFQSAVSADATIEVRLREWYPAP